MRVLRSLALGALFVSMFLPAVAQEKLSLRAAITQQWSTLGPERIRGMQWVPETETYTWIDSETNGMMIASAANDDARELLSLETLNKALDAELKRFPSYAWMSNHTLRVFHNNTYFLVDTRQQDARKLFEVPEEAEHAEYAPEGHTVAYTIDNNLYISSAKGQTQITNETDKAIVCGQAVHRFEFGIHKGTFWAEQGNQLAFYRKDESMVTEYPLVDQTTRPASLNAIRYPMAGMASHHATLGVYNLETGTTVYMKTGAPADHYLTNIAWDPSGKFIYIAELNRDQNHLQFNKYDVATGEKVATLFEEKDEKYVEPKHPAYFVPGKPNEFLWFSRRDGFVHLYHYTTSGQLKRQLTSGPWEVKNIEGFTKSGLECVFTHTNEDALEQHISVANLKNGKVKGITNGGRNKGTAPGYHTAKYAGGMHVIDTYSAIDMPNMVRVLDLSGKVRKEVLRAKNPLENYNVRPPQLIALKADDGTKLNGRLILPHDFDPNKKYPAVVYVYNGPGVQLVYNMWGARASLWMHYLANQGCVVFTVDGRGSSNRGAKFEQATFRKLGQVEMQDQVTGVDYLKSLPYVDAERMAVHGWSYGGYMTTSLMLTHPEVFKVGVAGGPVMDWKYYEVMYTERYMDTPETNPDGFAQTSLLDKMSNLEGKLLVIHGAVDDVVLPQHSMDFLKHCVDEGVQVDFFTYPGHPHNVRGKDRVHLYKKVIDYILESL